MLELCPIALKTANKYIKEHHRHHGTVVGHKFSIGATKDGVLVGVAICGRPVSRVLDDGYTLEITRLCTDGTLDVYSMLYDAAYRAARAMGYKKVVTHILDTETGSSLKAAGYKCKGEADGVEWTGKKKAKKPGVIPTPVENTLS